MTARGPRFLVVDDQSKTADFLKRHAPDLCSLGPSAEKAWAGSWPEAEAALARAAGSRSPFSTRFDIWDEDLRRYDARSARRRRGSATGATGATGRAC